MTPLAPRPTSWAIARGGPPSPLFWRSDAFRDGLAEPVREPTTLVAAAALDCARHTRGYGRRAAPDCVLCRGLGILTSQQGWLLAGTQRPVVVHCPDCGGRGWRR